GWEVEGWEVEGWEVEGWEVGRLKVERDGLRPAFSEPVAYWPRLKVGGLNAMAWPIGQG
ncbi:hypothetical protein LYNGBM3L_61320, partial [Moorena producens 3L]